MGSLRQFRLFALKYFFGLYSKYFINLQTLELGVALPSCPPWLRALWQPYSDCGLPAQEFVIERSSCAHQFGNSN